ncbi:TlpA family protein disulfide reductase [Mesoflavibacter sp. CH_XMU1422-2]|uniref:TlpA family protein disulfide reductase n=1 Tax=Mesoflavibacter sp. CH_XMU1422-2 TaxID=3107770 RepID=UPI003009FE72
MKNILLLILTLLNYFVYSQNNSAYEIEFNGKVFFDSEQDSLRYSKYYEKLGNEITDRILTAEKQIVIINKDSIIIEEFPKIIGPSKTIFIRNKDRNDRLDLDSGKKIKWNNPHITAKYRRLRNYKRIPKEDKTILNEQCEAWISESKNGWNKIWISKKRLENCQLEYPDLIVNGFLVLKRTKYVNGSRIIDFEAKSIKKINTTNFKDILEKHLEIDIKTKYSPIDENQNLSNKPIKVGNQVENFAFRNVFENDLIKLYDITKQKKYTIVEFWGTWCVPCLLANEKIKELKKTYQDKLSIFSINAYDRNISKLKKMIAKKQMDWTHGYSTEKLLKVFNRKDTYPRLVILNNENEVLFMGNPQVDFDKIKEILNK